MSISTLNSEQTPEQLATLHDVCVECWRICGFIAKYDNFAGHYDDYFNREDDLNDPDDSEHTYREKFDHQCTTENLRASAKEGCHLCSLLYDRLKRDRLMEELEERESTFETELYPQSYLIKCILVREVKDGVKVGKGIERSEFGSLLIMEAFPLESAEPLSCSLDLYLYTSPIENNAYASTASNASFSLAASWLQNCISNHSKCTRDLQSSNKSLPTRLIDVGPVDGSQEPRLYETSGGSLIEYLTLSYCWGKSRTLRLTLPNYNSFTHRIPMKDLPNTLRDAIIITRKLGYRYIWIDSLCIIQDSPADWQREAVTMGRVYSQSVCTIAALWAPHSDAGCFTQRDPLATQPCDLCECSGGNVYAVPTESLVRPDSECKVDGIREGMPLLSRAWVMQERLLSRRILYYGPKGLFWECHDLEANELLPFGGPKTAPSTSAVLTQGHPDEGYVYPQASAKDMWLLPELKTMDKINRNHFYLVWDHIVATYWASHLTYSSDILIALAGIVDILQQRTGMTFIGGVWKEFLPLDLLWMADDERIRTTKLDSFPSWSWASVRTADHLETSSKTPVWTSQAHYSLTEINTSWITLTRDVEIIYRRLDQGRLGFEPLGKSVNPPVDRAACIKLRAPLYHTTLTRIASGTRRNAGVNERPTTYRYAFASSCPIRFEENRARLNPNTALPDRVTSITCVVLARDMSMEVGDNSFAWIGSAGLMLKKVTNVTTDANNTVDALSTGEEKILYRRIGYWDYRFNKRRGTRRDFEIREEDYGDVIIV